MKLSILSRLQKQTPGRVLMAGVMSGGILLLLSFLLEIALVKNAAGQFVGYAVAPNWSLTFILAFPLFGFFVARVLRGTGNALSRLSPMLVEDDGSRADDGSEQVARLHKRLVKSWSAWADALFAICVIASWIEWIVYSLGPLASWLPIKENDWSVALNGQGLLMEALNAMFALLAFSLQGVWAGIFLAYVVYLLAFEATVAELTDRKKPPHLIPDFESDDPRGGFERLGGLVESMLSAFGAVYIALWCSRFQNLFLDSGEATAMTMFLSGWNEAVDEPVAVLGWILAGWRELADYSSYMVILGALLLVIVAIGMPLFSLRGCANAAKIHATDLLRDSWVPRGKSAADAKATLAAMKVFPILYPSIKQLIALALLAVFSLFFFRLGTVLFVWVAIALLTSVKKTLLSDSTEKDKDVEAAAEEA